MVHGNDYTEERVANVMFVWDLYSLSVVKSEISVVSDFFFREGSATHEPNS